MTSSTDADRAAARSALSVLLWAALVMGLLVAAWGTLIVIADLASHDDEWDGLGVYIGLAFALPALVPCALAGLALRVRRIRRPLAAGLGVLLVAPVLWAADMPLLLVPMTVGVGLVVVALLGPSLAEKS
jgi:hypothetical protein